MTSVEIAAGGLAALLVMILLLRIPIGLAMMLVGLGGTVLVTGSTAPVLASLKSASYSTFANYGLSVIPLFLLMGEFATRGGLSKALFRAACTFVGHRRGGLAMASIGACAGFGAICGSSLATAATMGQVALPEMRRHGYSGALATGTLAAGGTLGILIPPSIVLVIYAILTEQNIVTLFAAALLPALLAIAGYLAAIAITVRRDPASAPAAPRAPWPERLAALGQTWPVALIFLLVVGGIYLGWFTPTEAAAIGAAGTLVLAMRSGELDARAFVACLLRTAIATGFIFFILLGAQFLNTFLALTRVTDVAAAWIGGSGLSPWLVLAVILLAYLALGCVMDSLSMILLTVPIVFPIVIGLDFGLSPEEVAIWFGILVLIVVELGLITPPVGLNIFIINRIAEGVPMSQTWRGTVPFLAAEIMRVALLAALPGIVLFVPRLMT